MYGDTKGSKNLKIFLFRSKKIQLGFVLIFCTSFSLLCAFYAFICLWFQLFYIRQWTICIVYREVHYEPVSRGRPFFLNLRVESLYQFRASLKTIKKLIRNFFIPSSGALCFFVTFSLTFDNSFAPIDSLPLFLLSRWKFFVHIIKCNQCKF